MIEIRFSGLRSDRTTFDHPADVLIGVTADIEIRTDVGIVYSEEDFPVVELAGELNRWRIVEGSDRSDFEFDSMATPEPGWIWIRRAEAGWRVGSIHQDRLDTTSYDLEDVHEAVGTFLSALDREVERGFGLRLENYIRVGNDA